MESMGNRLSDSTPFFGEKVSFRRAFPQVESVFITVEDSEIGSTGKPNIMYYSEDSVGEFHDCTAPCCYKGGIRIGSFLRDMVEQRKDEASIARDCCGKLASPQGRKTYGRCNHFFRVTAKITYKV
jgi:hypothetical protein